MIKLVVENPGKKTRELALVNKANKPTPALVLAAAAELTFDLAVGYTIYRAAKFVAGLRTK